MRILHVIDSLNIGGAEMLLLSMLRSYRAQGHDLCVAYFTHGPLLEDICSLGVPVHRLSKKGLADPRALPRMLSLIRSWQPEVVHTHLIKSDLVGQVAAAAARIPVRVSSIHSINPWRRNRLLSALIRLAVSRAHAFIAVTAEVRDYTVRWSGYPADKITVIDNGVDLDRFDLEKAVPLDRSQWGVEKDALLVGIIGRLQPPKGHDLLLRAAVTVTAECPQVQFIIIGDGPLRSQIEAQRSQLGLEKHVTLAGIIHDVPGALAALDIVVFSSLWEGLPIALLEAMAMKRPVVATAVGGIPDVIVNGRSGLLVPAGDPAALATGLLTMLRDPELRRQLGENARATIQERYNAATTFQRVVSLYQSIRLASPQKGGQQ